MAHKIRNGCRVNEDEAARIDAETKVQSRLSELREFQTACEIWGRYNIADPRIAAELERLSHAVRALIPGTRESRTVPIEAALMELFEREPTQPGADRIASTLGRRASDVRTGLRDLVASGDIRAEGVGRNLHYVLVPMADEDKLRPV